MSAYHLLQSLRLRANIWIFLLLQRSLVYFHYMAVTWAPECTMSVTISKETSSGEHKVKVSSLVVSDDYRDQERVFSTHDAAIAVDQYGITGRKLMQW